MVAVGAAGVLGPASPAAAATCTSYTFQPGQLVTHDYEDPWWSPGDEITLAYPGNAFHQDGMHNGTVATPPPSSFVLPTGTSFHVNLYERDAGFPDRHLPDTLTVSTSGNTYGATHWFSRAGDYTYSLGYSLWSNGLASCPVVSQLRTVPDVTDLFRSQAKSRIEGAGLRARFVGSTQSTALAVDQDPPGGEQLPALSYVTVYMVSSQ